MPSVPVYIPTEHINQPGWIMFKKWFESASVSKVKHYLTSLKLPVKAL